MELTEYGVSHSHYYTDAYGGTDLDGLSGDHE